MPALQTDRPGRRSPLLVVVVVLLAFAGMIAAAGAARAASQQPCDIYAAGGTPCVSAHSTTRALYAAFDGPLYQVQRASDGSLDDIGVRTAGGTANAATQDSFCGGTSCTITRIYDQSGNGNTLVYQGAGGTGGADAAANATTEALSVGGAKAYALYVNPGNSYFAHGSNVPTGSAPEGEYMVTSGTHANGGCCFDYGNTEIDHRADGNGAMDAINFSTSCWFGGCPDVGPWVQADLENGLFSGGSTSWNGNNTAQTSPFVTAMLKNNGTTAMAIKGANATSGSLSTFYDGSLPDGYNPMAKQGAVILGSGGDCCQTSQNASAGTFYEGAITQGYPSDATDAAVQANITAAGYATSQFAPGSRISLRATTACCTSDYLQHDANDDDVVIGAVGSTSLSALKSASTWITEPGLADSGCVSFESADKPGWYIRHYAFQLHVQPADGSAQFADDATFCPVAGNSGSDWSFRSSDFPSRYLRHYDSTGYIASDGGDNAFDTATLWAQDSTWAVATAWSQA